MGPVGWASGPVVFKSEFVFSNSWTIFESLIRKGHSDVPVYDLAFQMIRQHFTRILDYFVSSTLNL